MWTSPVGQTSTLQARMHCGMTFLFRTFPPYALPMWAGEDWWQWRGFGKGQKSPYHVTLKFPSFHITYWILQSKNLTFIMSHGFPKICKERWGCPITGVFWVLWQFYLSLYINQLNLLFPKVLNSWLCNKNTERSTHSQFARNMVGLWHCKDRSNLSQPSGHFVQPLGKLPPAFPTVTGPCEWLRQNTNILTFILLAQILSCAFLIIVLMRKVQTMQRHIEQESN